MSIVFPEFLGRQISCHLALALSSHSIENDQHRKALPKPLTAEEERIYLKRSAEGDLEARNILIERNLRLVAHIMNKG